MSRGNILPVCPVTRGELSGQGGEFNRAAHDKFIALVTRSRHCLEGGGYTVLPAVHISDLRDKEHVKGLVRRTDIVTGFALECDAEDTQYYGKLLCGLVNGHGGKKIVIVTSGWEQFSVLSGLEWKRLRLARPDTILETVLKITRSRDVFDRLSRSRGHVPPRIHARRPDAFNYTI